MINIEHLSIKELLLHDAPMLLLDKAKYFTDDYIHTVVNVSKNSLFFLREGVPSYVALEYMAQSIAVWNGMLARQQNDIPKVGFLISSRNLVLKVASFKEDTLLDVHGKINYNDGFMASFDCWVELNKEIVATATLSVFQPSNIKKFMEIIENAK
jgi:predicted hotdog family 3-hydroxylacyl-ACP dehydratase